MDCYMEPNGDLWFSKSFNRDKTTNVIYFDKASVGGNAKFKTARKGTVAFIRKQLANGSFSVADENLIIWVRLLF